ncbi:MAG: phospholipase D-like domain-containing protein [Bdellovibrionales bacterium]
MKYLMAALLAQLFLVSLPQTHADQVQYLARPEEALSAFITTAAQAQKSIDVTTFIFEPCDASVQVFMDTLIARATAGVKVRVLIDDFRQSSEQKKNLAAYFAAHGIQLGFFNTGPAILMRSHTKFVVVDGKIYIAGGRNLADNYFGLSSVYNYADRDVLVSGKAALQTQASFNEMWSSIQNSRAKGKPAEFQKWQEFCPADFSTQAAAVQKFVAAKGNDILAQIPAHSCGNVQFLADSPDFADSQYGEAGANDGYDTWMTDYRLTRKRATKTVLDFLAGTRHTMNMEHAIYLPMLYLDDAIADLRARQVSVHVITNDDMDEGPDFFKEAVEYISTYFAVRDTAGTETVNQLSSFGGFTHAYELTPKGVPFYLHGKIFVRDQKDVIVGSFNTDARSYNTNLEAVTVVKNCSTFAGAVDHEIEALQSTYRKDVDSGKIPLKPEPSAGTKAFGWSVLPQL